MMVMMMVNMMMMARHGFRIIGGGLGYMYSPHPSLITGGRHLDWYPVRIPDDIGATVAQESDANMNSEAAENTPGNGKQESAPESHEPSPQGIDNSTNAGGPESTFGAFDNIKSSTV